MSGDITARSIAPSAAAILLNLRLLRFHAPPLSRGAQPHDVVGQRQSACLDSRAS